VRARTLPFLPLLALVLALATALHGWLTYRATRERLDTLVRELGEAIAGTAAAGLRSSLAILTELEGELQDSLQRKARLFAEAGGDEAIPERFARASGLRHVIVLDSEGRLVAAARDVPSPSGGGALDPARLRLQLEDAARGLVAGLDGPLLVREIEVPGAGLKRSLAVAVRLRGGGAAVLVQDAESFARVRAAADGDAVAKRLEAETRVAFVRYDEPAPPTDPERVLTFSREIAPPRGPPGILRIGIDRTPVRDALAVQRRFSVVSGALLVVVGAAGAWGLLRLRRAREELAERARRDDRLASLGRLAAAIAHEVRNPLNAIGLAVQRVQRVPGAPEEIPRLATAVVGEVERLNRTVEEILRYARPHEPRMERLDASRLLAGVEALLRREAESNGVMLQVASGEGLALRGDPDLLQGAAWNLVRNAIQASPRGETVRVTLARRGPWIALEVSDRGPGVPPEKRATIFEPFQARAGSGLGLPLALSAAQAHGGTIEVEGGAGGGALFRMLLPAGEGA